jgi:hypothetical protein
MLIHYPHRKFTPIQNAAPDDGKPEARQNKLWLFQECIQGADFATFA